MAITNNFKTVLILIVLSFIFFFAGNNILSLTNPDEVFYSQTAKEMMQQKSWAVPYLFGQPQFEKPVLTYWLMRIGFQLFGVTNFSARFFPALFAAMGVIAVYLLALFGLKDRSKAMISALVLMSAAFYIGMARTVFTDMIFSVLVLFSFVSFFWGFTRKERKASGIVLFFVFSGLAVLTKGPLGFFIPMLAIILFLGFRKELNFLFCKYSIWGFLIFLLISAPWYVLMLKKFGSAFVREFFYNDHIRRIYEAEHEGNDRWYFYPASMVLGMFPWSIFVFLSFFSLAGRLIKKAAEPVYLFLACWILITFAVFQVAHSKLTSYILPLFPALAVITGSLICDLLNSRKRLFFILLLISWFMISLLPIGLIISSMKYSQYIPSRAPIHNFIVFYAFFLGIALFLIYRRKLLMATYLLMFILPMVLFFALSAHKSYEDHVSSKGACDYLLKNHRVENTILCSKPFVRGVRFNTDKKVAVINVGGANFFSPHPIPYLDTLEKVEAFLKEERRTYCIISKSGLGDIERIARGKEFKIGVLKIVGNEYIVEVQYSGD